MMHHLHGDVAADQSSSTDFRDAKRNEKIAAALDLLKSGPGTEERILGIQRLGSLVAHHTELFRSTFAKSARIRAAAAESLGWFREPSDRGRLELLTTDSDSRVRTGACLSLGHGEHVEAFELLLDIASDDSEVLVVRGAATLAAARLAQVGTNEEHDAQARAVRDVAADLHSHWNLRTDRYAEVLAVVQHPEARPLVEDLIQDALSREGRPQDARALMRALNRYPLSETGRTLVVRALDGLPGGRTAACQILKNSPDERARPLLESLLNDPGADVVSNAVAALCALGMKESLPALARVLHRETQASIDAIAELSGTAGFDLAEQIVSSGGLTLRPHGIRAMMRIDPVRAQPTVEQLATDANPSVRLAALRCLVGHSADPERWREQGRADNVEWVSSSFGR